MLKIKKLAKNNSYAQKIVNFSIQLKNSYQNTNKRISQTQLLSKLDIFM